MARLDLEGLPGAGHVRKGIEDLEAGRPTVEAALLQVASRRLTSAGLSVPSSDPSGPWAEIVLYERLESEADPYGRYCALLEELDSFMDALEARLRRERNDPRAS
jgi:hypothetical protein